MTICPRCGHDWPTDCESAVSVTLFDSCLWCRRKEQTDEETAAIKAEYRKRKANIEYRTKWP